MYCTKCGTLNNDSASTCINCGISLMQMKSLLQQPAVKIPTYLIPSILATLLCCMPLGIPAIYFAAQVNLRIAMGDIEGAKATSRNAKIWFWITLAAGLIFVTAQLVVALLSLGMISQSLSK